MTALKYALMILGLGLFGSTGALVAYDIFVSEQLRRLVLRSRRNAKSTTVPITARGALRAARGRAA